MISQLASAILFGFTLLAQTTVAAPAPLFKRASMSDYQYSIKACSTPQSPGSSWSQGCTTFTMYYSDAQPTDLRSATSPAHNGYYNLKQCMPLTSNGVVWNSAIRAPDDLSCSIAGPSDCNIFGAYPANAVYNFGSVIYDTSTIQGFLYLAPNKSWGTYLICTAVRPPPSSPPSDPSLW